MGDSVCGSAIGSFNGSEEVSVRGITPGLQRLRVLSQMVFAWGAESFVVHLPDWQSGDTVIQPPAESLQVLVCGQSAEERH